MRGKFKVGDKVFVKKLLKFRGLIGRVEFVECTYCSGYSLNPKSRLLYGVSVKKNGKYDLSSVNYFLSFELEKVS